MAHATQSDDPVADLRRRLIRQADTCVACGMCLPVCPTYTDTREESESARGRISLIRGLAEERLAPTPALIGHLDRCLQCQACEAICPAGVRYGELIDGAHALLQSTAAATSAPAVTDRLAWFVRTPRRLRLLGWFLAAYRASGLRWLARRSGLVRALGLQKAERFSDVRHVRFGWRRAYPALGEARGRVALFTGCVANLLDRDNLEATIRVLQAFGYRVDVPPDQGCCGAIDLHAGRHEQYAAARAHNLKAFAALDVDAVVYIASGCGAVVNQYEPSRDRKNGADAGDTRSVPFVDVNRFIIDMAEAEAFTPPGPDEDKVYLHIPCSMKNATHEQDAPKRLLDRMGLRFQSSASAAHCCGAAGTYSLRYPDLAERLGRDVLQQAQDNGCRTIATCNVGCAMHMQALAKEDGLDLKITHPVRLAAQHLSHAERATVHD